MLARLICLFTAVSLAGCGKSAAPAPAAESRATTNELTAPPPAAAAPAPDTAPTDEAALNELLGQLTQVARKFAAEQQRVPQSLEELVARGYLSRVPTPPPGRAFVINQQLQVELRRR